MNWRAFGSGFMEGLATPFLMVFDIAVAVLRVLADYASGRR